MSSEPFQVVPENQNSGDEYTEEEENEESQNEEDYGATSDQEEEPKPEPEEKDTLMQECADEWNTLLKYATGVWNSAKDFLKIKTPIPSMDEKERILRHIFTRYDECFYHPIIVLKEEPLQWIYNWKRQRGVVYNWGSEYSPENFQKVIMESIGEENKDNEDYIKDIPALKAKDILLPSKGGYGRFITKTPISKVGIVDFEFPEKKSLDKIIEGLKKIQIEDVEKVLRKELPTDETEVEVKKLTSMLKKMAIEETHKISSVGAIGVNLDNKGIISTKWSPTMIFKAGYTDPHFKFLGDNVEYWRPHQHMLSGKQVYEVKDEVFKNLKRSKRIYLKIQSVDVMIDGETKKFYYFRKFADFNDFLKLWQMTYIKNYYQLGTQMEKETNYKKLEYQIDRREKLYSKVKDINVYFQIEISRKPNEEKLCGYVNDPLVHRFITERDTDPEIELSKRLNTDRRERLNTDRRENPEKLIRMLNKYVVSKKRKK